MSKVIPYLIFAYLTGKFKHSIMIHNLVITIFINYYLTTVKNAVKHEHILLHFESINSGLSYWTQFSYIAAPHPLTEKGMTHFLLLPLVYLNIHTTE